MGHNTVVLLGTQGKKPRQQQRLFVRGITHQAAMDNPASAEAMLLKALDEVLAERGADGVSRALALCLVGRCLCSKAFT